MNDNTKFVVKLIFYSLYMVSFAYLSNDNLQTFIETTCIRDTVDDPLIYDQPCTYSGQTLTYGHLYPIVQSMHDLFISIILFFFGAIIILGDSKFCNRLDDLVRGDKGYV